MGGTCFNNTELCVSEHNSSCEPAAFICCAERWCSSPEAAVSSMVCFLFVSPLSNLTTSYIKDPNTHGWYCTPSHHPIVISQVMVMDASTFVIYSWSYFIYSFNRTLSASSLLCHGNTNRWMSSYLIIVRWLLLIWCQYKKHITNKSVAVSLFQALVQFCKDYVFV